MTEYTADDFKNASFARRDGGCVAMRHGRYWVDSDDASFGDLLTHGDMADAGWVPVQENPRPLTAREHLDAAYNAAPPAPYGTKLQTTDVLTRNPDGSVYIISATGVVSEHWGSNFRQLDPLPRPEWVDAPAVRAWHKDDGRTERDGKTGAKRIWSPDYRTTEYWSTPSLMEVHWSDLVDVEALGVTAELARAADRVNAFMSVRVTGDQS